ncbi:MULTISPECIES: hypothetical protein [Bacillaceae]|uniref:hypothetical protein n=1 Tax=Bacillaceae TaxID=186817 RepID=UPI000E2F46D1|nr:hypothetical protein [Bacillus sp. HNG]RFB09462.1 hypothetical protein DZB84_24285 [Bacillus sp. HNG]
MKVMKKVLLSTMLILSGFGFAANDSFAQSVTTGKEEFSQIESSNKYVLINLQFSSYPPSKYYYSDGEYAGWLTLHSVEKTSTGYKAKYTGYVYPICVGAICPESSEEKQ